MCGHSLIRTTVDDHKIKFTMRSVHVKPAQVLQAIGFAMFGAALYKVLGPLVSPVGTQSRKDTPAQPKSMPAEIAI